MIEKMVAALGEPMLYRQAANETLTVGRWRHADAEVSVQGGFVPIVVNISNSQRVEWFYKGRWSTKRSYAIGSFAVVDPEVGCRFAISGRADVLQLFLPLRVVREALGKESIPSIPTRFQAEEPSIERCAMRALVAVHTGEVDHSLLFSELAHSLATCITSHTKKEDSRGGGLTAYTVRRLGELIEHRVLTSSSASLSLRELAKEANLSVFHFAREFRRTMGVSPYAYVLSKRLFFARSLIATTPMPVADVAAQTGFKSRAHFGALFRRQMGVSPATLRRAIHRE
jgi:AraC family transcriptional regulator